MHLTPRRVSPPLTTLAPILAVTLTALTVAGCNVKDVPAPLVCPSGSSARDTVVAARVSSYDAIARCWDNIPAVDVQMNGALGSGGTGDDSRRQHGSLSPLPTTAKVRAAYELGDNYEISYIYLWVQWHDPTGSRDASRGRWHFGPTASTDPEYPPGWSTWEDDDKLAVMWPVGRAAQDTFVALGQGCAMACHTGGRTPMRPKAGGIDVWYWKAGGTNPIAYAEDWGATATRDLGPDSDFMGAPGDQANRAPAGGPASFKDPARSQVYIPFGNSTTVLDSTLYLLASAALGLGGDAVVGDSIYTHEIAGPRRASLACVACHGANGTAEARANLQRVGRDSTFAAYQRLHDAPDTTFAHEGFRSLGALALKNVVARVRAMNQLPARTLQRPLGSAGDLRVLNWDATYANGTYTVVFRRKLLTTFVDDRVLDPALVHPLALAVMDRDAANHSGSPVFYLKFAP